MNQWGIRKKKLSKQIQCWNDDLIRFFFCMCCFISIFSGCMWKWTPYTNGEKITKTDPLSRSYCAMTANRGIGKLYLNMVQFASKPIEHWIKTNIQHITYIKMNNSMQFHFVFLIIPFLICAFFVAAFSLYWTLYSHDYCCCIPRAAFEPYSIHKWVVAFKWCTKDS